MAAHVFDAAEPTFESAPRSKVRSTGTTTTAAKRDAPMFAAQPAVFERLQQRQGVGAKPLIGLAVGAVLVGGMVFAMSQHSQNIHSAAGIHAVSQPAAATPAPVLAANPAPVKAITPESRPNHLRIVTEPPRPVPVARHVARPIVRARQAVTETQPAPAAAPETAVTPPAPMAITPAPQPIAPAPSVAPQADAAAPVNPAPQPAPTSSPDASGGQPTPQ